ncbi:hypothetical protein [Streptomyces sp. NBC_01465]|uniref:hypothetical protein n=1 Tax=Streptomyces sp. NBC_01465 TaxID=2903878 RepID=UPI002E35391B|nr:hypothetical protein [Streptomyces sp. NBC_01465]
MALRVRWFLAVVVAALVLTGCGGSAASGSASSAPSSAASASAADAGVVSLNVSGGFAGVRRGIEIRPGGKVLVTDRKGGHTSRDLSDAERTRLGSLLDAVDFAALPARSIDERSRDRFEYRLVHNGRTLVTDGSRDLGAADDLIAQLERWISART